MGAPSRLVKLAETGASGKSSFPSPDGGGAHHGTTKMLARDSTARNMLLEGLRAVPLREHIAQAASLGAMIVGMTVGKWWATRVSGVEEMVGGRVLRRAPRAGEPDQSDLPGRIGVDTAEGRRR